MLDSGAGSSARWNESGDVDGRLPSVSAGAGVSIAKHQFNVVYPSQVNSWKPAWEKAPLDSLGEIGCQADDGSVTVLVPYPDAVKSLSWEGASVSVPRHR